MGRPRVSCLERSLSWRLLNGCVDAQWAKLWASGTSQAQHRPPESPHLVLSWCPPKVPTSTAETAWRFDVPSLDLQCLHARHSAYTSIIATHPSPFRALFISPPGIYHLPGTVHLRSNRRSTLVPGPLSSRQDKSGPQAALDALPSSASTTPRILGSPDRATSGCLRPS